MEEASGFNQRIPPPPSRGLSLGWRLALSITLIISLVMGGISVTQQFFELRKDREVRRELLKLSLIPLAIRLEKATTPDSMLRNVEEFHTAYVSKGYPVHDIVLLDAAERQVLSTRDVVASKARADYFRAGVPIASPLIEGGQGTLVVLKSIQEDSHAARRGWLLWAAHFTVTVGVVLLFLAAAIYFQVTRPLNQLVRNIKKMEMGYWGLTDISGGAWGIRWLAWRFGNMVEEVRRSMTHLVEAERKAWSLIPERAGLSLPESPQRTFGSEASASDPSDSAIHRDLMAVCKRLEAASPDDSLAVHLARGVWRQEVLEANRLGFHPLKVRLEDAALRLMDPDTFTSLDKRLGELKVSWGTWTEQQHNALYRMLKDKAIPCAGVLHRVKHTAGVWAKMQEKGLDLDEIYDLFAFRIIVPTEADCYAALGVIHQAYKPEVSRFKDYIARPKGNGYRSLHTCVRANDGPVFEIQIRSVAMARHAERGNAAHWLYKKSRHEVERESLMLDWRNGIWRRLIDAARRSFYASSRRLQQWRFKP